MPLPENDSFALRPLNGNFGSYRGDIMQHPTAVEGAALVISIHTIYSYRYREGGR